MKCRTFLQYIGLICQHINELSLLDQLHKAIYQDIETRFSHYYTLLFRLQNNSLCILLCIDLTLGENHFLSKFETFTVSSRKCRSSVEAMTPWNCSTLTSTFWLLITSLQSCIILSFSKSTIFDSGSGLVLIDFLTLSIQYFALMSGARTTTLWSLSTPFLSASTCNGAKVVGGW